MGPLVYGYVDIVFHGEDTARVVALSVRSSIVNITIEASYSLVVVETKDGPS